MDADARLSDQVLGWIVIAANVNLAGWIIAGVVFHGQQRKLKQARLRIALLEERSECASLSWRPR